MAWEEAQSALTLFHPGKHSVGKAPSDWSNLVTAHEPVAAVALAVGNFPQLVRDLHQLTQARDVAELRAASVRALPAPCLTTWADELLDAKNYPQALLAIGALRLPNQFDSAE